MILLILFIFMDVLFPQLIFAESKYAFDLDEIEKKSYSFGGYVETCPVFLGFDKDAALYKLKLYNKDTGRTAGEYDVLPVSLLYNFSL